MRDRADVVPDVAPVPSDPPATGRPWALADRADRLAAALLGLCAVGAVGSAVAAYPLVRDADPTSQGAEAWRMVGYLAFAGIFVLLARTPRHLGGLWLLTITAKAALPLTALTIARGADDATTFLVADGVVTALLVTAYLLTNHRSIRGPAAGTPPIRTTRSAAT